MTEFVRKDLEKVDELIKQSLSSKEQSIDIIGNYIISAGGKRMRPLFAILSAKLFGYEATHHIKIAAAIELIHTATLFHDDVVDESKMRRGRATANEKWGNKHAVLVGDFLFSQAFKLMVATDSLEVLDTLSRASSVIAEGEIKQLTNIRNVDITREEYVEIVKAKTAELFGAACKTGAIIAGQSPIIQEKMYEFGVNVGIAFQIIDDVLDYTATDSGKEIGKDFKEGNITLPVILAYKFVNKNERDFKDFDQTMNLMINHDSFNKARSIAAQFIANARLILDQMPKHQEISSVFISMLEQQIGRQK